MSEIKKCNAHSIKIHLLITRSNKKSNINYEYIRDSFATIVLNK